MTRSLAIAAAIACFAQLAAAQPRRHAFTADDWAATPGASAVAVSPDGRDLLYVVTVGTPNGPSSRHWHLAGTDGGADRSLELPTGFSPTGFTKDGAALYGSYEVNHTPQLAVLPLAGIGPDTVPSTTVMLPSGIGAARLSPDGSKFLIVASPRPPDPMKDVRTVIEPDASSLYVVNADGTGGAWWCPALAQVQAAAWASDSASIAVASSTPKVGHHDVRSFVDVCRADGARRVAEIGNSVNGVAWADGGSTIAFLSTTNSVLTPDHVWTVPASGGIPMDRTPTLEGSAMMLRGGARGQVWVLVEHGVQNEVDTFAGGALAPAFRWADGVVLGPPVASDIASAVPRIAVTVGDPAHSPDVAVVEGTALRKITHEGDAHLEKVALGPVRVVRWTSKEGIALEGIATFPAGYQEGRKYPFLVLPHGGPEGNDSLMLDALSRIIAGLGYVVLQPQYRGSTGYGADFLQAIYQHFGDRAYRDVDSATDYAIAQGWADPARLAIFGWSAGGFMTAWTVTQTSRYKAAIEGAGITDWASFMWTSDMQQIDYDQRWPEADPQAFLRFSAVMQAAKVTTPLLVLHGEADVRVPTYQGREYFEALLAHGKTTRMVTYPGSGHFPTRWDQRRDVFREVADWLARYNP
ncbi:MAG: alpha/beta hydrolase family protein [Betaproteobacteria bacterium]